MIECRAPQTKQEFEQYYHLRWQVLRAPWQQPEGSEKDEFEHQSIHRCLFNEQQELLAVGRIHFTEQFVAQIRYMAVSDSARGQGLGAKLLAALEHEAWLRGAAQVQLNAREQAVEFYQTNGYQTIEKTHVLYQEVQHYLMAKPCPILPRHQTSLTKQLQNTWHDTIPMSKAMNLTIGYYDGDSLYTQCDPAFNKNLHNTMFAGSIYTHATLTGWGWVYLLLENQQQQGDIVLADASIKYLAPVAGVAHGRAVAVEVEGDLSRLALNKNARVMVKVDVLSGDKIAAKFVGQYAVIPKGNKNA